MRDRKARLYLLSVKGREAPKSLEYPPGTNGPVLTLVRVVWIRGVKGHGLPGIVSPFKRAKIIL